MVKFAQDRDKTHQSRSNGALLTHADSLKCLISYFTQSQSPTYNPTTHPTMDPTTKPTSSPVSPIVTPHPAYVSACWLSLHRQPTYYEAPWCVEVIFYPNAAPTYHPTTYPTKNPTTIPT